MDLLSKFLHGEYKNINKMTTSEKKLKEYLLEHINNGFKGWDDPFKDGSKITDKNFYISQVMQKYQDIGLLFDVRSQTFMF